jgi:hypothetical protein
MARLQSGALRIGERLFQKDELIEGAECGPYILAEGLKKRDSRSDDLEVG